MLPVRNLGKQKLPVHGAPSLFVNGIRFKTELGLGSSVSGCSVQFPIVNWGSTFDGWAIDCGYENCVLQKCQTAFVDRPDMMAGCQWYVDWFETADNPGMTNTKGECPAGL